jgi:acyl-coenzyme A synthetase/AMP-(fatty) acid ligase
MRTEIIAAGRRLRADELDRISSSHRDRLKRHRRIAVLAHSRPAYAVTLLLGRELDAQVFVAPSATRLEDLESSLAEWGVTLLIRDLEGDTLVAEETGAAPAADASPGIVIFTSGSTGKPKLARHSWETIAASSRYVPERLKGATWFMAYEPGSYAGLQVFFSALAAGGRLVIPAPGQRNEHPQQIVDNGVDAISATPTWWRMLINAWPATLPRPRLIQATLGGEPVPQGVLDLVNASFEPERLTHIYASTEAGTAIVVSDGREGFPVSLLDADESEVGLRVRDGLLEIRSPRAMQGYVGRETPAEDGWIRTADKVEIRGDRCYFAGREDGVINVGGMKVSPEEIEAALGELPGVGDCAVYARRNPIVGAVLAADVVSSGNGERPSAEAIRSALGAKLAPFKVPQFIRFVDELVIADSGKKVRK